MIVNTTDYFRKINEENGIKFYDSMPLEEKRRIFLIKREQNNYPIQWVEIPNAEAKRLKLREVPDAKRIEKMLRSKENLRTFKAE